MGGWAVYVTVGGDKTAFEQRGGGSEGRVLPSQHPPTWSPSPCGGELERRGR